MAKKQAPAKTVDDVNEPVAETVVTIGESIPIPYVSAELASLIASGIVYGGQLTTTGEWTSINWREGHLEHVARTYAASPAQCERDYHDELAVAKVACWEQFEALVSEASAQ